MAETKETPRQSSGQATKKSGTAKTTTQKVAAKKVVAKKASTPKKEVNSNEFAVIETGGKQYRVSVGDTVQIEKLSDEMKAGDKVVFDKVLFVDNGKDTSIGNPFLKGAKVSGVCAEVGKLPKVDVVKYKAKSRYHKRSGHRQPFCKVMISAIL